MANSLQQQQQQQATNQRLEELTNELQKMKTIILKHEMRIRELEKKVEQQDHLASTLKSHAPISQGEKNGDWGLLPDEV